MEENKIVQSSLRKYIVLIFLILFGVTRFFLEFLRDNQKVFGNVSILALHCVLMVVVGAVWLIIRQLRDRKVSDHQERYPS